MVWTRQTIVDLRRFLRRTKAFDKALAAVVPLALAITTLAVVFVPAHMTPGSVRTGLGVIAEVSGAVLGALLVVIALMVEQRLQARERLRRVCRKYHGMMRDHLHSVEHVRQQIVSDVVAQKVTLDDLAWPTHYRFPSELTYRDVIASLSALCFAFADSLRQHQHIEEDLDTLGYRDNEKDGILTRSFLVTVHPDLFFKLVADCLDARFFAAYADDSDVQFAVTVWDDREKDGVDGALRRLNRSNALLGGKLLASNAVLLVCTTVGSVCTLMGLPNTDTSVTADAWAWAAAVVVACFAFSVLSTLFLIGRLLR